MHLSGANVGTLGHRGLQGKVTVSGFDHDGSNFEMPPNIFGQYVMDSFNLIHIKTGTFGGSLTIMLMLKVLTSNGSQEAISRRVDIRVYGIHNVR